MDPEGSLPSGWLAVFWVAAACNLVDGYRLFRGACRLHHPNNPEDSHHHTL